VESVQKKVREIQPSREEKRFDEIGWAPSIVAGRALSQKLNRPLFLFTYMTVLAWVVSFVVYQGGRLLGLG